MDYVRDNTTTVDGVGDVLSFSRFDLAAAATSAQAERSQYAGGGPLPAGDNASRGLEKVQQSLLSFIVRPPVPTAAMTRHSSRSGPRSHLLPLPSHLRPATRHGMSTRRASASSTASPATRTAGVTTHAARSRRRIQARARVPALARALMGRWKTCGSRRRRIATARTSLTVTLRARARMRRRRRSSWTASQAARSSSPASTGGGRRTNGRGLQEARCSGPRRRTRTPASCFFSPR